MRGQTLLMILKLLWLKILHPKATVFINLVNTNYLSNDTESFGWWIDHPVFVDYKYGTICIERIIEKEDETENSTENS